MADSVNNNGVENGYKYNNPEISKFDIDKDNQISVFDVDQITDENSKSELAGLLEKDMSEQFNDEITEEKIQSLEGKLSDAKNNQGMVGSLWNGIKNITGLGSSTKKCELALEDYKNGKISYDEAESIISGFESKQESSVNLAANILTGVAATLVVSSAVFTGGLSLGLIAGAAVVGAGTKAGLKFLDRATNKVKGDAVDAKQIVKDSLSGAVDGAVSVATMGMGTAAVTSKTVAEQTLKETVKQGIISGAQAGAVSGAVTGASDYTIEAALEEDVEFNAADLAKSTLMNAAGGAVAGGIMGGVSSGIQYNKFAKSVSSQSSANDIAEIPIDSPDGAVSPVKDMTEVHADSPDSAASPVKDMAEVHADSPDSTVSPVKDMAEVHADSPDATVSPVDDKTVVNTDAEVPVHIQEELADNTHRMHEMYQEHIDEAEKQIKRTFSDIDGSEVTARPKSEDSIMCKLIKKYSKDSLKSTSLDECLEAIGDAYGTRIQIKSISPEESREIIESCLHGYDITYEQFIRFLDGDTSTLDETTIAAINEIKSTVIDSLKERQTQEVVDKLVKAIRSVDSKNELLFPITELNNYGDEISSYFTARQLQEIADAYNQVTHQRLKIVSLDSFQDAAGEKISIGDKISIGNKIELDTTKAIKESGYASSQINVKHKFSDGTIGNGEFQIRGKVLNEFADAEHIPYDIRSGKITASDKTYSDIYSIIESMSDSTYEAYNEFLTRTYQYLRLKELGIEITPPVFNDPSLSEEALRLLSPEGLIEISARKH